MRALLMYGPAITIIIIIKCHLFIFLVQHQELIPTKFESRGLDEFFLPGFNAGQPQRNVM